MSDMLADMSAERMCTLSHDRETMRLQLPPLQIAGMPEPLRIHLDFDAEMVDEILKRLMVLRSEMLPATQHPGVRAADLVSLSTRRESRRWS